MPILVLSYNKPELTARAVRSAVQHSENVFLLHNGSLPSHVQTLKNQFPEIEHLVLEKNRGFSGGMNFGLKAVLQNHTWAFALTNDCELLTSLPGPLPEQPQLISPLIWSRQVGRIDSSIGIVNFKKASLRHHRAPEAPEKLPSFEKIYTPGSAFLIHREIFETTRGFDESLGTYWEDVDLSLRLRPDQMAVDTRLTVLHKIGKTCHHDPHYTTYLFQRNRRRVMRRHCPLRHRLRLELSLFQDQGRLAARFILQRKYKNLRLLVQAWVD